MSGLTGNLFGCQMRAELFEESHLRLNETIENGTVIHRDGGERVQGDTVNTVNTVNTGVCVGGGGGYCLITQTASTCP